MNDEKLDWTQIHRRLESVNAAIEHGFSPGPDDKKKIMQARAKLLARPLQEKKDDEYIEALEFLLAHENYGIESRFIREVYPLKGYTSVPCTPPFVLGLINVRGQVLSVIDLKTFFKLPEKNPDDLNNVVIIHDDKMEVGILADVILGVRPIPLKEIQLSLTGMTDIHAEYLRGVTMDRVVILDAKKILSDARITVHEEV